MPQLRKRRYARYPDCFGEMSLQQLIDCARHHGMRIISAMKPNVHVYNEIGLYGDRDQMEAAETDWRAAGHKLKPRGFGAVFGVPLQMPQTEWLDRGEDNGMGRQEPPREDKSDG